MLLYWSPPPVVLSHVSNLAFCWLNQNFVSSYWPQIHMFIFQHFIVMYSSQSFTTRTNQYYTNTIINNHMYMHTQTQNIWSSWEWGYASSALNMFEIWRHCARICRAVKTVKMNCIHLQSIGTKCWYVRVSPFSFQAAVRQTLKWCVLTHHQNTLFYSLLELWTLFPLTLIRSWNGRGIFALLRYFRFVPFLQFSVRRDGIKWIITQSNLWK